MSLHHNKPQTAHAEAALGAGRPYEKANKGHNEMFNDMKDFEKSHQNHQAPSQQSRGQRIDRELEQEDEETIEKMKK